MAAENDIESQLNKASEELEQTLLNLVNAGAANSESEQKEEKPAEETTEETATATDDTDGDDDHQESDDQGNADDSGEAEQGSEDDKQGSDSSKAAPANKYLSILEEFGYDTDGLTEEEAKEAVLKRVRRPAAEQPKPQDKPAPTTLSEVTTSIDEGSSEKAASKQSQETSKEKRLYKLIRERDLEDFVVYKDGVAVPKEGQGAKGTEAARKINEYITEYRKRIESFAEDPVSFLIPDEVAEGGDLVEKLVKLIRKELGSYSETQKKEAEQQAIKQQQLDEHQKQQEFLDEHAAELYKLNADGKPKLVPGEDGDVYAMTDFGKLAVAQYNRLVDLSPSKPASVLMQRAYEIAKEIHGSKPASPVQSGEQKKKKFLENRGGKRVNSLASRTPATPTEMAEGGTSLIDLILSDPQNADNPILQSLREAK